MLLLFPIVISLAVCAAGPDTAGISPLAPPNGPARRALSLTLSPDHTPSDPLASAQWRISGVAMADALPFELRTPPTLTEWPLALAWPGLHSLPDPVQDVLAHYPCPPPSQPRLITGLAMASAGLTGIAMGEVLENRMLTNDSEPRAQRLYRAGLVSSFTGLALILGGGAVVADASVQACRDDGVIP